MSAPQTKPTQDAKRKLSYNEQRELAGLPVRIETLEKRQAELEATMSEPGFFQSDHEQVQNVTRELGQVQQELESAFERWDELEG